MYTIRRNYVKVISSLTVVSCLIVYVVRIIILNHAISIGTFGSNAIALTAFLWLLWNSYLWKKPCMTHITGIPNLSGRWVGSYKRNGPKSDGINHGYVLEIKQTYSSIWCTTYQDNNTSSAGIVSELCVLSDQRVSLVFHWHGMRTSDEKSEQLPPLYRGLTCVTYSKAVSEQPAMLTGEYFTNQGTTGYVDVCFEQENLQERYAVE